MKAPIDETFNVTDALGKYPKILDYGREHAGLPCVAFEKHDGSNLGFRWLDGWWRPAEFRSGRTILEEMGTFRDVPRIFDELIRPLAEQYVAGAEEAAVFCEFRGGKSFSGEHVAGDPKTLHPIDLWVKGRGFMPPEEFATAFNVEPVYRGKLTAKFVEDVRAGRLGVNEGVVCKGGDWGSYWSCKIKTRAWLAKGGEP